MGMFDDIHATALKCPLCGQSMSWQSKDGPCLMEQLTIHELFEESGDCLIYTDCPDCRIWVDVTISRQQARTPAQWEQYLKDKKTITPDEDNHQTVGGLGPVGEPYPHTINKEDEQ